MLNVTVNDPDQPGFITAYPCQVCLFSDQTTHLLADVNGTF